MSFFRTLARSVDGTVSVAKTAAKTAKKVDARQKKVASAPAAKTRGIVVRDRNGNRVIIPGPPRPVDVGGGRYIHPKYEFSDRVIGPNRGKGVTTPRVEGAMLAPTPGKPVSRFSDYGFGRGPAAELVGIKPPSQWVNKGGLDKNFKAAIELQQTRNEVEMRIRRAQYDSPFAYIGRSISNAADFGVRVVEGLPAAAWHGATETVPNAMRVVGLFPGTTAQGQIAAAKDLYQQDVKPTATYYGTLAKEAVTDPVGTFEKRGAEMFLAAAAGWNAAGMATRGAAVAAGAAGRLTAATAQAGSLRGGMRVARGQSNARAAQRAREIRDRDGVRPAGAPQQVTADRQYRFISSAEQRAATAKAAAVTGNRMAGRVASALQDIGDWGSKSILPGSARYRANRVVAAPTHDRSGRRIGEVDAQGNPVNVTPSIEVPRRAYSPNPLTRIVQKRVGEPVGRTVGNPLLALRDKAPWIPSAAESALQAESRNMTYEIPEGTDATVASVGRPFAKLVKSLSGSATKNGLPTSEVAQGVAAAAIRAMGAAEGLGGSKVWGRDVLLERAKKTLADSAPAKRSERKALENQIKTLESIPDEWLDPATAPKRINDLTVEAAKVLRYSTDVKRGIGLISGSSANWGGVRTQAQLLGARPLSRYRDEVRAPISRDLQMARAIRDEIAHRESNGNRGKSHGARFSNYSTDALRTREIALRRRAKTIRARVAPAIKRAEENALAPYEGLQAAERRVADARAELARLASRRTPDPAREAEIARLQDELDQKIADAKFEMIRAESRAKMAGQGSRALRRAAAGRARRAERGVRYEISRNTPDARSALGSAFAAGRRYGLGESRVRQTTESTARPARGQSVPMPATFGDVPNAKVAPGLPTRYSIAIPGEQTQTAATHRAALDIAASAGPGAEQVVIRRIQGGKYTVVAERVVRGKKGVRIEMRPSGRSFDTAQEARAFVQDLQRRKVRYDFAGEEAPMGPRGQRRQGYVQMLRSKGRLYSVTQQQRAGVAARRATLEPAIRKSGQAQGARAGTTPQARRAARFAAVARGNTKGIPSGARGTHARLERLKGMRQEERKRSVGTPAQISAARTAVMEANRARNTIRGRAYKTAYYGGDLPKRAGLAPGEYFPHRSITPDAAIALANSGGEFRGAGAGMTPREEQFNAGLLIERGDIDLSVRPIVEALRSAVDARERTRVASAVIERFAVRDINGRLLEGDAAVRFAEASGDLYTNISGRKLAEISSLSMDTAEGQSLRRLLDEALGADSDKTYVIPAAVMRGWNDVLAPAGKFGKTIDQIYSLWKGGVLALSPRWYFQNMVGMWGQFILGAGADLQAISMARNPAYADTLPGRIAQSGLAEDLGEYARQAGGKSSNPFGKLVRGGFSLNAMFEGVPRKAMFWASTKRSLAENKIIRRDIMDEGTLAKAWLDVSQAPQKYGKIAANARRLADKATDPAAKARYLEQARVADLNAKGANMIIDDAINVTERFMGNYSRYNALEKKILKRIFPFYGWMRAIHRLAFALPVKHPKRTALVAAASSMAYEMYGLERNDFTDPRAGIFSGNLMFGTSTLNPFMSIEPTLGLMNTAGQNIERANGIPGLVSELASTLVDAFKTAAKQAGPLYEQQYRALSGKSVGGTPTVFSPGYQGYSQDYRGQYFRQNPSTGALEYGVPTQSPIASIVQSIPLVNAIRQGLAGGRPYADASEWDLLRYGLFGDNGPEERARLVQNDPKMPRILEPSEFSTISNILTGVPIFNVNSGAAVLQEYESLKRYLQGLNSGQRKLLTGVAQAKAKQKG